MDKLPYHMLTNVLEVISAANESLDGKLVRQKVLDALFRTIPADGAIFFLPDEEGQYTHTILKNLELTYCNYYKKYYHRLDPLQLNDGLSAKNGRSHLTSVISYDTFQPTEFYNDFLRPQNIHHKLVVNMVADKELYGRIVLTRARESKRFSKKEIQTAETISPYLTHALVHNDLKTKIKVKGSVLDHFENQSLAGIILLDQGLRIIYKNRKAAQICGKFKGSESAISHTGQIPSKLLYRLINDCREIKADVENCPGGGMNVPRYSVIKGPNHTRFSLISKVLDPGSDWEGSQMFMVSIQEESHTNFSPQYLMDTFHLSKRETDVVSLLFSGLKNAQIADNLFVTEITIKKHLQNIYTKVGVSNRTKLINRILTA